MSLVPSELGRGLFRTSAEGGKLSFPHDTALRKISGGQHIHFRTLVLFFRRPRVQYSPFALCGPIVWALSLALWFSHTLLVLGLGFGIIVLWFRSTDRPPSWFSTGSESSHFPTSQSVEPLKRSETARLQHHTQNTHTTHLTQPFERCENMREAGTVVEPHEIKCESWGLR